LLPCSQIMIASKSFALEWSIKVDVVLPQLNGNGYWVHEASGGVRCRDESYSFYRNSTFLQLLKAKERTAAQV